MNLIERKRCPVCDKEKFNSLFKISYNDQKLKNFLLDYYHNRLNFNIISNYYYEILECINCKFIFQKNIPNDKFSQYLYENVISSQESLDKKKNLQNFKKKYDFEISLIKSIFKGKNVNVLEFGAGWGFWAKHALENGINIDVFEISKERINYMRKNGLNVIEDLNSINKKYDFVYSDQTIEHLNDPHEIFKNILPQLKSGGYFLINYPSTFMFKKKLNKNYQPQKDAAHPLEHLNLFNKSTIKFFTNKYNLELVSFKSKYYFNFRILLKDIKNYFFFDSILLKNNN